jgi:hypothetical protein
MVIVRYFAQSLNPQQKERALKAWMAPIVWLGLLLVAAGPAGAFEWEEGFAGIGWGADIAEQTELVKVDTRDNVDYYVNTAAEYTIGDVQIPHVVYGFYGGRLFAVFAMVDTLEVHAQLKGYLQSRFGLPLVEYASEGRPTIYRWKKNNLKIKLKTNEYTRKMKLALYYTPISSQVNEERAESRGYEAAGSRPRKTGINPVTIPLLD